MRFLAFFTELRTDFRECDAQRMCCICESCIEYMEILSFAEQTVLLCAAVSGVCVCPISVCLVSGVCVCVRARTRQAIVQSGGDVADLCLTFSASTTAFGESKVNKGRLNLSCFRSSHGFDNFMFFINPWFDHVVCDWIFNQSCLLQTKQNKIPCQFWMS